MIREAVTIVERESVAMMERETVTMMERITTVEGGTIAIIWIEHVSASF